MEILYTPLLILLISLVGMYVSASELLDKKDQEIKTLQYQIAQYQEHIQTLHSFARPGTR